MIETDIDKKLKVLTSLSIFRVKKTKKNYEKFYNYYKFSEEKNTLFFF